MTKGDKQLIKYHNTDYSTGNPHSELILIRAFDKLNNVGGYKIENEGIERLIELFDSELIIKVEN